MGERRSASLGSTKAHALRLSAAGALTILASAAAQADDPENGHALARRWCVSCHQVDPDDPARGVSDTLQMLANKNRFESRWLRAWLYEPHPHLEGVIFTRYQINDIIAYLKSIPVEPSPGPARLPPAASEPAAKKKPPATEKPAATE